MDRQVAIQIDQLMREYSARLDESVALVRRHCSDAEFLRYRRAVGTIMGEMLVEIMNPLYREYPDLRPPELRA